MSPSPDAIAPKHRAQAARILLKIVEREPEAVTRAPAR